MDANKLEVLREIDYQIHPTCGSCLYSVIRPGSDYGICGLHTYEHQKHSSKERSLSVNRYGSCPEWVGALSAPESGWGEFWQEPRR